MKRLIDNHPLRAYLASLTKQQQEAYCAACGTKLGYLRKYLTVLHQKQRVIPMDIRIVAGLVTHSRGRVTFASLRPDVDWPSVRSELNRQHVPAIGAPTRLGRPRKHPAPAGQEAQP